MRDRDAENLGVCRMLLFAFALVHYGGVDFTEWAHVPAVFWRPMALFRLLPLGFPSYQTLWIVQWIWRASVVLSCAGLFTRSATFVAGICGAYLIALPNNYSNVHRIDAAFVLALLVMALSRSGDAWSLDAIRNARRQAVRFGIVFRLPRLDQRFRPRQHHHRIAGLQRSRNVRVTGAAAQPDS